MPTAVRTPLHPGGSRSLGNKRYRKEILTKGLLHVDGQTFDVTDAYIDAVMDAFQAGAIKSPPIKVADSANTHTKDPFRRHGTVVGLHRTARGLDADLEPDEQLGELLDRYPDTGVSVLIEHDRTTGGGTHYPAALAHLLITEDPVINNLGDWALAASHEHPPDDVLDLLALSAASPSPTPAEPAAPAADSTSAPRGNRQETPMAEQVATLTDDELAGLRSLAALAPQLTRVVTELGMTETDDTDEHTDDEAPDDDTDGPVVEATSIHRDQDADEEPFTDAELDDMARAVPDMPQQVAASHNVRGSDDTPIVGGPSDEVLALTQQLNSERQAREKDALRLSQVEADLNERRYHSTRTELATEFGIHPQDTDIIRPLIEGSGVGHVALSHGGKKVDVAATVLKFAKAVAARPRLDLSQAKGHSLDIAEDDGGEQAEKDRAEFLARAKAENGR